ncbi:MAG: ChaN family lipoprotein [Ferruginibacter sp.]
MELEITKDAKQQRNLVLGAEMFEQDNQQALDLYLQNKISVKGLDSMARLWKNYPTDYAPLVDLQRINHIAFAATNIPRRYAAIVSKGGFEALDTVPANQKTWIAPLPIAYDAELPGYKNMMTMMGGHGSPNMPKAQAIKDATMAYLFCSILCRAVYSFITMAVTTPKTMMVLYGIVTCKTRFENCNRYYSKPKRYYAPA